MEDKKLRVVKHFRENIRSCNSIFTFTSMGGKIDNDINDSGGPYAFSLHGMNYHRIGSLLLIEGERPKFVQLYIYDTHNEASNRMDVLW